jgi:hypothetical protein
MDVGNTNSIPDLLKVPIVDINDASNTFAITEDYDRDFDDRYTPGLIRRDDNDDDDDDDNDDNVNGQERHPSIDDYAPIQWTQSYYLDGIIMTPIKR